LSRNLCNTPNQREEISAIKDCSDDLASRRGPAAEIEIQRRVPDERLGDAECGGVTSFRPGMDRFESTEGDGMSLLIERSGRRVGI
jgi:hypothetical protein